MRTTTKKNKYLKPVVGGLQLALQRVAGAFHGRQLVGVPFVLVVRGQLEDADDFVDLVRHSTGQVVAILGRLFRSFATCCRQMHMVCSYVMFKPGDDGNLPCVMI